MQDYRESAFVIGLLSTIQIEYNFGKAFSIFIIDLQSENHIWIHCFHISVTMINHTGLVSNSRPKILKSLSRIIINGSRLKKENTYFFPHDTLLPLQRLPTPFESRSLPLAIIVAWHLHVSKVKITEFYKWVHRTWVCKTSSLVVKPQWKAQIYLYFWIIIDNILKHHICWKLVKINTWEFCYNLAFFLSILTRVNQNNVTEEASICEKQPTSTKRKRKFILSEART